MEGGFECGGVNLVKVASRLKEGFLESSRLSLGWRGQDVERYEVVVCPRKGGGGIRPDVLEVSADLV